MGPSFWITVSAFVGFVAAVASGRIERHWAGLGVALALLVAGCVSPTDFVFRAVDWDVLGLILGMSIMTSYLEASGVMDLAARWLMRSVNSVRGLLFLMFMCAGIVSLFLENVSVVLLFAPIAIRIAERMRTDPAPMVLGIALASNISGSATMVGDPQAIIAAGYFNLAFTDFIWYGGKPSMFFITLVSMTLACAAITAIASRGIPRRALNGVEDCPTQRIDRVFVTESLAFLGAKIALLSVRHIVPIPLSGAAAVGVGGLTIARAIHRDYRSIKRAFVRGFEWRLLLFLIGVFTVSYSFAVNGPAQALAHVLSLVGPNLFLLTSSIVALSVAVSAFVDNIPYIAAMLPVVRDLGRSLGIQPIPLAWALLLGATLGGNLTYIGASANATAVRILEKHGRRVGFYEFMKLSTPFNTVSVLSGWAFFEALWA